MEKSKMIVLLYRFERYCNRNSLFVAKRLVRQEIENLKGVTEQKCQKRKLREDYCKHCDNINCNLNQKKESKIEKEILEKISYKD